MGYRMSTYESPAHLSPYFVLFGRQPLLRHNVSKRLRNLRELDLDDDKAWVQVVGDRTKKLNNGVPMAMKNMVIAQARDRLRYADTIGGTYRHTPKQYRARFLLLIL